EQHRHLSRLRRRRRWSHRPRCRRRHADDRQPARQRGPRQGRLRARHRPVRQGDLRMTAALLALTRPRGERPWWLRRPGALGIGALVLFASLLGALDQPDDAQAIGLPDLNPAHWAVKGFVAILNFLFGDTLKQLANSLLALLLHVP